MAMTFEDDNERENKGGYRVRGAGEFRAWRGAPRNNAACALVAGFRLIRRSADNFIMADAEPTGRNWQ